MDRISLIGALAINLIASSLIIATLLLARFVLTVIGIDPANAETFQAGILAILVMSCVIFTSSAVINSQSRIEAKGRQLDDKGRNLEQQEAELAGRDGKIREEERRLNLWEENLKSKEDDLEEQVYAFVAFTLCGIYIKEETQLDWLPSPELANLRFEALRHDLLEDLENKCSQIAEQIRAAFTVVFSSKRPELKDDPTWMRAAIMLPGTVRNPSKAEDKGKRAMFARATTDTSSYSYREGRYLLEGDGCAGQAWKERKTVFGRIPEIDVHPDGCGSVERADLHAGQEHEHPFKRLACIPVFDPADRQTVVAILSLDTRLEDLLVDRQQADILLSAAMHAACQQLGILIRCCYEAGPRIG